jgi:hypothetical protein
MTPEILGAMAQFGSAGLIGWMWLTERLGAAEHERRVSELHQRVLRDREVLDLVVQALRDNTRAMAELEAGQQRLARALERMVERGPGHAGSERAA